MAYPGITDEQYRTAFEQLCTDHAFESVSANMLQKKAGGRYSRAADMLEVLKAEWRKAQQEQQLIPVQPGWYRDVVTTGLEKHRALLEGLWSQIGPHIEERILEATTRLEGERDQMTARFQEDRAHIELLENNLEATEQRCIDLEGKRQQVQKDHDELNGKHLELQAMLTVIRHELQEARQAVTEMDMLKQRNSELIDRVATLTESERDMALKNQHLTTVISSQKKTMETLDKKNTDSDQENRILLQKISKLETLLDQKENGGTGNAEQVPPDPHLKAGNECTTNNNE